MFSNSQVQRLLTQHEALEEILNNLPPEIIYDIKHPHSNYNKTQSSGDKWTINDQLGHIATYHDVFLKRVKDIVLTLEPHFDRYVADEDPEFAEHRKSGHFSLFMKIKGERENLNDYLFTLKQNELRRTGIHKKYGRLTISEWTEFFLLHEAHHIFSVFQLVHSDSRHYRIN